jgi:hypothetical protein
MSESDRGSESESEHELYIFKRIHERLKALPKEKEGYKVITNSKLASALDKLGGSPFTELTFRSFPDCNFTIHVKGEEAGTWMNPDVSVLQKHAIPSPFGRGEETVIDPSYRNGTEIKADDLTFSDHHEKLINLLKQDLARTMFVGKKLRVNLYKLAIYGEEGHFDWHRDSTHSDAHHGTLLFALNTEWEGGDFMLRHGGVKMKVDMNPVSDDFEPALAIVAFYTDMEHKVMPVTKGVRFVLQYDIEVVKERRFPSRYPREEHLEEVACRSLILEKTGRMTTYLRPKHDNILFQAIIDEIQELHNKGKKTVGFPLFHLYRRASVKREYLKGNDSTLFDVLNDHFDISVNTVLICHEKEEDRKTTKGCIAYRYSTLPVLETKKVEPGSEDGYDSEERPEFDSGSDSDLEDGHTYGHTTGNVVRGASFHLPGASAVEEILKQQLAEWLGNEEQDQEQTKYYAAGMFVNPKHGGGSSVHEGEGMITSDVEEGSEGKIDSDRDEAK